MKIPTLFSVKDFSFSFGKAQILRDLNFDVTAGEYLSIIGPNGAGKTTLLKCLVGIYAEGDGSVALNGKPLDTYSRKEIARLISYVPQAEAGPFAFTAGEFVLMGRYPHLSPFSSIKEKDREAAIEAMGVTGTLEFTNRHMETLSGGERQKVFIAAALAQGAQTLLLDEPTTFLDPRHSDDVMSTLSRLNEESGVTIVSVTHDINIAALECDRVLALKDGRVAFWGSPGEIMENMVLENIFERNFIMAEHPVTGKPYVVPGRALEN
ncbi:MAG: ABC transporter ATP-binding protein [bacterium]